MTKSSALSVREFIARAILEIDGEQSPTETICLAWTLRNRAAHMSEGAGDPSEIGMAEAEHLCQDLLADMGLADMWLAKSPGAAAADGNGGNGAAAADAAALNRALACVSMVWDGVVADPTNGATRVHLHNEEPDWAENCQATALMGAMLFFRAEPAAMKG